MADNSKKVHWGNMIQAGKYNSIIDGKFKPVQSAVNEMRRKPYGSELLTEESEEEEREEQEQE